MECNGHIISYYLIPLVFLLHWFSEALLMKRILTLLPFLALSATGCAIVSGTPAGNSTATMTSSQYEPMESQPPAAQHEDLPKLAANEIWVPGYYEPVAGTWIWHQGQATAQKDGYRLVPATYRQQEGKVQFAPPRWRRADLAPRSTEMSAQK